MAANDYVTVAQIKAALTDTTFDTSYDTLMQSLATAASRALDRYTGRPAGAYYVSADSVRYFDGSGERELWIDELAAAPTTVAVAETGDLTDLTTWASTDYIAWPYNELPILRLDVDQMYGTKSIWHKFAKAVKITGKWGYAATLPADIQQAATITAVRWFKRSQQAFRDMGAIQELGQLQYVKALDPDVQLMLDHLRRMAL